MKFGHGSFSPDNWFTLFAHSFRHRNTVALLNNGFEPSGCDFLRINEF